LHNIHQWTKLEIMELMLFIAFLLFAPLIINGGGSGDDGEDE